VLAENADKDPILRHGAVMGLVGVAKPEQLVAKKGDANPAVRVGAVLALRRMKSPLIAEFLRDADEGVALETARAIHDVPIPMAMPALAELANSNGTKNQRILERVVNANYRLGQSAHALSLASSRQTRTCRRRSPDALDALAEWAKPNPKDRVLYQWRPLPDRPRDNARVAIAPALPGLLKGQPAGVMEVAARVSGSFGVADTGPALAELVVNEKAGRDARIAALEALKTLKDPRLPQAAKAALQSKEEKLRAAGLNALAGPDAVNEIGKIVMTGSVRERQGGINALVNLNSPEAKALVGQLADKLIAGECAPEIQLDVYEAAKKCGFDDKAQQYKAKLPKDDLLANDRLSLTGGDAERGRKIFREKAEVQCLRCHKCEIGDSVVGPDLTKIGATRDRNYLLQSIVCRMQSSRRVSKP
jgi:quinoprotein glucose dehydrogenase